MTDELRATFFTESEDLLAAMSDGLAAMTDGTAEAETVHAVFRAVHSIKGAAGAFALSDVVSFAHSFETVLDAIRSDRLVPDTDVMRVLQRAGDILADLLEAAREGRSDPPDSLGSILDALEEIGGGGDELAEEDFVFQPLGLVNAFLTEETPPRTTIFELRFRPTRRFYRNGHEPTNLFAALSDLGELTVACDMTGLPAVGDIDLDESYLAWTLRLETEATEDQVRDVFAFVEELCELDIQASQPALGFLPLIDIPEIEPQVDEPRTVEPRVPETPATAPQLSPPPRAATPPAKETPRPTLRVDLDRVDRLINSVGELIINQAVIAQKVADAGLPPSFGLTSHVEDLSRLAREIQEGVMMIRAQPVKPLFQRMARVVREAAEATGKQVELVTEGEETEVDRTVVEGLADPLTHMVRNAIDHGIETPDERTGKGKPAAGRLLLSASHVSGNVRIVIKDDGAGLNRERIQAIAVRKGLIPADAVLSESEIDNLLFLPGFSTAASVTSLSGRGVGMDVARTAIMALGGRIGITSRPGEGTTFIISLPLTLAVLDGLIVSVAGQPMIVPASAVVETIRPASRDFVDLGHEDRVLNVRGVHVPIVDVASVLSFGRKVDPADAIVVLVRTGEDAQAALAIGGISDKRQVVIKSLRGNVGTVPGVSAATILGDGKVALILDPDTLVGMAARRREKQSTTSFEARHEHAD